MSLYVVMYLTETQNLYHLSGVVTGLCDLAARGAIELELRRVRDRKSLTVQEGCTVCLEVQAATDPRRRTIYIDLYDRTDYLNLDQVRNGDVYFKRSFYVPDLDRLVTEPSDRQRVVPFGLNYACRSRAGTRQIYRALTPAYISTFLPQVIRHPRQLRRLLRNELAPLRMFQASPRVEEFEQPPTVPLEPAILFQTRVWSPDETAPDDPVEINEGRASVVRALREAFGPRFHGGLLPNDVARRNYPDLITTDVHRRHLYIQMSKRYLVGVYTRGLHHSLAFKLPEFLAASKCIVSDPQRNALPAPLKENEHYLLFRTPEECVQQCARLLSDPELASRMRAANYDYYQSEIQPSTRMLRCLERVFDQLEGASAQPREALVPGNESIWCPGG